MVLLHLCKYHLLQGGEGCQPFLKPTTTAPSSPPRLPLGAEDWWWRCWHQQQYQRETSQERCSWTMQFLSFKGCHSAGAPLAPTTPASPPLPGSSFQPRDPSHAHSPAHTSWHQRMFIFYCANNSKLCEILLAS